MPDWTIGGQTFAALRVTKCSVSKNAGAKDTAILKLALEGDAAAPFALEADVDIVHPNGTTFFRGIVQVCEPCLSGRDEHWRLVLDGRPESLMQIGLKQPIACVPSTSGGPPVIKYDSQCLLGYADDGERQNTAEIISSMLAYAAGQNSNLTAGSVLSGTTITAPQMEVSDCLCGEAIRSVLRWHPDAIYWYDHSANTLNVHRPAALGTVTLAGTGAGDGYQCTQLDVAPRLNRRPRGVEIYWRRTSTLDGAEHTDITVDSAGATTGRRVLTYTVPLQGAQITTQTQTVEVAEIPEDPEEVTEEWLMTHIPELKETGISLDVVIGYCKVRSIEQEVYEDEEVGPGTTLAAYPNELIKGTIQPWMAGISACRITVLVEVIFTGGRDDNPLLYDLMKGGELRAVWPVQMMGTDAITREYTTAAGSAGEEPVMGLAADIYDALDTDWPEGTATFVSEEVMTALHPGKRLTLTGAVPVTAALVQGCTYDVMTGTTTVAFGPAGVLSANDMIELMRAGRRSRPLTNTGGGFRTDSAASSGRITGATGGRIMGSTTRVPTARVLLPFEVTQASCGETDGTVTIEPGRLAWWAYATVEDGNTWPTPESYNVEQDVAGGGVSVTGNRNIWLKVPYSVRSSTTIKFADDATRNPGATLDIDGSMYGLTGVEATQFYYPEASAISYEARGTGEGDDPDFVDPAYGWVLLARVTIDDGVMSIKQYRTGTILMASVFNPDSRLRVVLSDL